MELTWINEMENVLLHLPHGLGVIWVLWSDPRRDYTVRLEDTPLLARFSTIEEAQHAGIVLAITLLRSAVLELEVLDESYGDKL